jgi:hypothetical protein
MSLRLRSALPVLLVLGCSNPKPPESNTPEPPATPDAGEASAAPATETPMADTPVTAVPAVETLFVKHERAPCEAEGTRECLQVRGSESEAWRNFFGTIAGFEYEPGHDYELRVEVTRSATPPSDAPSSKYKLLEVLSKRKVEK